MNELQASINALASIERSIINPQQKKKAKTIVLAWHRMQTAEPNTKEQANASKNYYNLKALYKNQYFKEEDVR